MEFFSPGHLIVLAIVVAVLFFGWKQLPDMSRSLGRSLRIFKTEIKGMGEDDKIREEAKSTPAAIEAPPVVGRPVVPQAVAQQQPVVPQPVVQPQPVVPQPVSASNGRPRPTPRPQGPTGSSADGAQ